MDTADFRKQLKSILEEYKGFEVKSRNHDLSDLSKADRQALVTRAIAAINRIGGPSSTYSREVQRLLQTLPELHLHTSSIVGVVKALLHDVEAGQIQSLIEIVHGDVFSDFLEMAQHLCDKNYKDAAAVIAGATLENHIRALCNKSGIPVETTKTDGDAVPKKTDAMNSDLGSASAYSKLDQKNVTAWLDLRNKAAHGKYGEYSHAQVALFISGVRDFITRVPA